MYKGKHVREFAHRTALRLTGVAAAAVLASGLGIAASGTAMADPAGVGVVQNPAGEAGYFANDNGQTRFRDVRAQLNVTNQLKFLSGVTQNPGAAGVELCDPNSGYAAQLGVEWVPTSPTTGSFQVKYGLGSLGNAADPCIQNGLVTNPTPQQLLSNFTINAGDHLQFEIYYSPTGRHHTITLNVCDTTQDVCRQAQQHVSAKNFYEAGIGVVTQQVGLTAPALNGLVSFTNCSFNYYSSTTNFNRIFVPAHWNLKRSDFVNSSSQVVMSSNGSLDGGGHAFNMFEGSTSA